MTARPGVVRVRAGVSGGPGRRQKFGHKLFLTSSVWKKRLNFRGPFGAKRLAFPNSDSHSQPMCRLLPKLPVTRVNSDRPLRPAGETCLEPSSAQRRRAETELWHGRPARPTHTQPSRHVRRPDADRLTVPAGRRAGGVTDGRRSQPAQNEPGQRTSGNVRASYRRNLCISVHLLSRVGKRAAAGELGRVAGERWLMGEGPPVRSPAAGWSLEGSLGCPVRSTRLLEALEIQGPFDAVNLNLQ